MKLLGAFRFSIYVRTAVRTDSIEIFGLAESVLYPDLTCAYHSSDPKDLLTEDIEDWRNSPESNPSVQLCGQKPKVDSVGRAQQLLVTGVKQRDVVSSRCEHPDEGF